MNMYTLICWHWDFMEFNTYSTVYTSQLTFSIFLDTLNTQHKNKSFQFSADMFQ